MTKTSNIKLFFVFTINAFYCHVLLTFFTRLIFWDFICFVLIMPHFNFKFSAIIITLSPPKKIPSDKNCLIQLTSPPPSYLNSVIKNKRKQKIT